MADFGQIAGQAVGLGVTYATGNGVIGGIWIDCTVKERHRLMSEISDHPVEDGPDVSDHVRPMPRSVTLDCVISNTPLAVPQSHADGARMIDRKIRLPPQPAKLPLGLGEASIRVGPLGQLAIKETREATVKTFDPPFDRVQAVWQELDAMHAEGRVVSVHTTLGDYHDMAIEDVDVPRDVTTFASLRFTITLRQIRRVESARLAAAAVPSMPRAAAGVSRGKQSAKEVDSDAPEPARASALHRALFGAS